MRKFINALDVRHRAATRCAVSTAIRRSTVNVAYVSPTLRSISLGLAHPSRSIAALDYQEPFRERARSMKNQILSNPQSGSTYTTPMPHIVSPTNRKASRPALAALGCLALAACGSPESTSEIEPTDELGSVEVALTNAPNDVHCLEITVAGKRTDVRSFPVVAGEKQLFRLTRLPIGVVKVSAEAFSGDCEDITESTSPTWLSEVVAARVTADRETHVALSMIHNGRASVGIDFNDSHGPIGGENELEGGTFSSSPSYLLPSLEGVIVRPILTVGDAAGTKNDGSPYRMVGIPDGLGAFDNGDDTFTLLVNHELEAGSGIARAHGGRGAFISQWVIRKADLAVLSGQDLIQRVVLWDPTQSAYAEPTTGVAFGRFCSADLPDPTALYDVASGLGFDGSLFFNGEEIGNEGRVLAHALDGTTYELPRLGKASWENVVPNPKPGVTTVAIGLDDSGGGQLYIYAGSKTDEGSPVERAGLTNGRLFGLRVIDYPVESNSGVVTEARFEAYELGNVENWSGARLDQVSNENRVTRFQRPEDGAWDPNDPNHFYFATTASFEGNSRLWRLEFVDSHRPELGGIIRLLLDGSEGHRMLDNLAVNKLGQVYLQEDVGGNARLGKVWRYEIATDELVEIAAHDPAFFATGGVRFLTNNEEASGIIDASHLLGPGWFLSVVQAHHNVRDSELVSGGQIQAIFDPAAAQ